MELLWKLTLLLSLVECLAGKPPKHALFYVVSTIYELLFIIFFMCVCVCDGAVRTAGT